MLMKGRYMDKCKSEKEEKPVLSVCMLSFYKTRKLE